MIELLDGDAAIVLGFSEPMSEGVELRRELTEGKHAFIGGTVEIVPVVDALYDPSKYKTLMEGRTVIGHSGGSAGINAGAQIITFNGVEPKPWNALIRGAARTSANKGNNGDGVLGTARKLFDHGKELARYPTENLALPSTLRRFSTIDKLVEVRPLNGALAVFTDLDEFGFGSVDDIKRANDQNLPTATLLGKHDFILTRPEQMLYQLKDSLGYFSN